LFKKLTIVGNAIDELSHVFVNFHRGYLFCLKPYYSISAAIDRKNFSPTEVKD
jgi:hypothetical protein